MSPRALLVTPLCALAVLVGVGVASPALAAPAAPPMTKAEKKVLSLANAERAKKGCKPLKGNNRLALAARRHSKDMAVNHYFSHDSQDGTSPWTRIKRAGYKNPGAENIAYGYPSAQAVMKAWMKSPGHRANILNCKLKAMGTGRYKTYWTQDFGWT